MYCYIPISNSRLSKITRLLDNKRAKKLLISLLESSYIDYKLIRAKFLSCETQAISGPDGICNTAHSCMTDTLGRMTREA